MSNSSLLKNIFSGQPQPIQAPTGDNRMGGRNPFLQPGTMPAVSAAANEVGVNRPLRHPMFVGYRDNRPIYAGSRLFVLY